MASLLHSFILLALAALVAADDIKIEILSPPTTVVSIPNYGNLMGKRYKTISEKNNGNSGRQYYSFSGIPYANPAKRFSPTTLRTKLTNVWEVFDATQTQIPCWQMPVVDNYNLFPGPYTEDCLTLSVHTPGVRSALDDLFHKPLLPVIVYIHGGSFSRWGASKFDGARLLNRDVVLVSIQFRLNMFGLWTTESDDAPGNIGIYDMIISLQWVQEYIKSFGGDPTRVTIAGHSSGAAAVTFLMDSPMAVGLFNRAISADGDDLAGWAVNPNGMSNSLMVAGLLGCYNASNPNIAFTTACMRALPAEVLIQVFWPFTSSPSVQTWPLSIPKTNPVSPLLSLATTGLQARVPLMIGTCKNDGSFMTSRTYTTVAPTGLLNSPAFLKYSFMSSLLSSSTLGMVDSPIGIFDTIIQTYLGDAKDSGNWHEMTYGIIDIFSVFYFKAAARTMANGHSAMAPTYMYSFDYYGNLTMSPYIGGVPQVPRGVAHVEDIVYLFHFGDFTNDRERDVSRQMLDYWANFAATGNPNKPNSNAWPAYSLVADHFLKINSVSEVGIDFVSTWAHAADGIV